VPTAWVSPIGRIAVRISGCRIGVRVKVGGAQHTQCRIGMHLQKTVTGGAGGRYMRYK
jgi:hypothetical protein